MQWKIKKTHNNIGHYYKTNETLSVTLHITTLFNDAGFLCLVTTDILAGSLYCWGLCYVL